MPFLLEAPDCDAGTSNNSGHIVPNQEQESEPKEDNSTSSSLPSELNISEFGSDVANKIQGAEGPSTSPVEPGSPSLDQFNLGQVLGEGGFGKVFLAEHKNTEVLYAIKALKKEHVLEKGNLDRSVIGERLILVISVSSFLVIFSFICRTVFSFYIYVFHEKEILQTVSSSNHPFLVSLHGTFQTASHLFYVMEYLPGGDMFDFIRSVELEEPDVM
eukprot:XP_017945895.1 PREDICTED: calcium-independent protein kinase C-like [Xenopus tropicalis]